MSATEIRGRSPNRAAKRITTLTPNGFTYIGLLIVVMVMGAGLAAVGELYSHAAQREKERELLFVGHQFRDAIRSYYERSPGTPAYPKKLEDLVSDNRFPTPQHHLRRIYPDPMTGKPDWVLIEAPGDGGIMGVHSRSQEAPIKTGNFDAADAAFAGAARYADWEFVYVPPQPPPQSNSPAPASNSAAPKG
ncbi:MAG TPA: type II secretion system protein [Burkholderiales bacterium]